MRMFHLLLAALVLALGACAVNDDPPSEASDGGDSEDELSVEYKLAVIDGNAVPDDDTVRQYGRALDLLERYCPEDRERIADMTVASQHDWRP